MLFGDSPCIVDMAEHPEGFPLEKEQAVIMVCSTQVREFFSSIAV